MNQNICNNCGGEYQYLGGRFVCQSCGSYMPEAISNEEIYCGALTSIQFGGTPLQWVGMWKGSKWKDGSSITQVIYPGGVISIG